MLSIQASLETDDPSFCGIFSTITNTNNPEETTKLIHKKIHCRFCAEIKNYHNELLDISENHNDYEKFISMLSFFRMDFIDLSETNILPKTICETCYISFHEAFVFFNKVKQSQVALSNLYNGSLSEPESCPVKLEPENDENNTLSHGITPFHTVLYQKNKPKIEDQENDDAASLNVECKDTFPIGVPIISESPIVLPSNIDLVATPSFGDILQDQSMLSPKMDNVQDNSSDTDDLDDKRDDDKEIEIKPEEKVLVPLYNGIPIFKNDEQKGSWTSYCWRCKWCNTLFRTSDDLRCHGKEVHASCFAFECSDCAKECNTFFEFIEHVREHRSHLKNYCKYCNRRFETPEKCVTHEISHTKGHTIECELCGELCSNSDAFARHKGAPPKEMKTKKPKRVIPKLQRKIDKNWTWENYEWTCQECLLRAPTVGSLRDHVREVHNKCFAMKCTDCIRVMTNYRMFVEHVRKHRPYLRRYCQYCNKSLKDVDMVQHVEDHLNSDQRPCDGCGQIFSNKEQLSVHMKKYESPRRRGTLSVEDLTCDLCQKVCQTLPSFRQHRKTHDQERKREYTCDSCGKSFYTSGMLKEHIKTHDVKTEVCEICKKKFHTKPKLKAHVATHSGLRPFPCNECGKCFRTDKRLKVHLLLHTDIKPFKCLACGKEFRYKIGLKVHENQHTGLRPYPCERCEKTFANWANCNKHMIRKHGLTLAKTKLTALGRLDINRETGQPTNISADEHAREWMDKIINVKRGKGVRGKRRPTEPSSS